MADDATGKVARDAAVQSLVSNGVYLLIMIGLAAALTRRDWIARQAMRARQAVRQEWRHYHAEQMIAELQADVSRIEHREPGC